MSVKKYLTLSGLTYFLNKIKTYLTSSTYLNSIGISNSDIDDIADDAGYSSGSLPASEDIFITGDIIPNTDNSVDLGASSKNIKMIYTKGITIDGTQFLPSDYVTLSSLSTVATSGSYNDLSNKPTIPTVNNATLTIQQNGTTVDTFTANSSTDKTVNIAIPTKTSDLTNDSNFVSSTDLATVATSGSYNDLSNKPTIPTVNNATLTIQKNGANVQTFTANQSTNATANITVPTKTSDLTNDSGFITSDNTKIPLAGGSVITGTSIGRVDNTRGLDICGGISFENGGFVALRGKNTDVPGQEGAVVIGANNGSNNCNMLLKPDGTLTWGSKNVAMQEDVVPRSGGTVMTGDLYRVNDSSRFHISGGTRYDRGGTIILNGKSEPTYMGVVTLECHSSSENRSMWMFPNGTWIWDGTACQITSDQRYKQQITEIDDKLLDAWEDVEPVQFKYNDAVDQKGDNARLHTGFVVQQIDKACKEHGVDISSYGLYCHEEYPEETEEVEVEQADGTKVKETKVIREASEHYSLRYTEALIVECAYLRKRIKELEERLEKLEGNTK